MFNNTKGSQVSRRPWPRLKTLLGTAEAIALALAVGMIGGSDLKAQENQANSATLPSFEVASIKLDKSHSSIPGAHFTGVKFNATNSVRWLIMEAYGCHSDDQLSAGPQWIKSELYAIDAKVENSLVKDEWIKLSSHQQWDQVMLMVRSLLAERFKLKIEHETRELPVFALMLAKNGPKFAEDNSHIKDAGVHAVHGGEFEVTSSPLSNFASILEGIVAPGFGRRLVLDKTGLRGNYSFKFRYQWMRGNFAPNGGLSADGASSDSSGPSLFTALRDQLGLKLESIKAPVDVLVIDHIERPSEN